MRKLTFIFVLMLVSGVAFAAQPPASDDAASNDTTVAVCPNDEVEATPAAQGGKGKPGGGQACCDPALEPGGGVVPLCFEGHTCCADGRWSCNNADGSPSCESGTVCDAGCGSGGASCSTGADCCSGACKGNGTCR